MVKELDRVKIWNSYLIEAREFAAKLTACHEGNDFSSITLDGGTLSAEEHYKIMTIIHSVLAVEARINHLLHELKEKGVINETVRDLFLKENIKFKWAFLPTLIGKDELSYDTMPHQAISELYVYRSQLIHVIFKKEKFLDELPSKVKVISLYNNFIEAMEDMNVLLGRHDKTEEEILIKLKV